MVMKYSDEIRQKYGLSFTDEDIAHEDADSFILKNGTGWNRNVETFWRNKPKVLSCPTCDDFKQRGGWSDVDLLILHKNGHVWPGFAGEPDGGNFGGSDF